MSKSRTRPPLDRLERVQLLDLGQRLVALRRVDQRQGDRVALHAEPAIVDPGGAQAGTDVADHALQALLEHGRDVDLEQQIGAALQVEAERDRTAGQEAGQAVAHRLRQEVGQQRQDGEQTDGDDHGRAPGKTLEHVE